MLVSYVRYDSTANHQKTLFSDVNRPVSNQQHGIISQKANKRVRLAIDWMLHLAKEKTVAQKGNKSYFSFKLNFVTLTLASKQIHSDNVIKSKLLNQFLTELRTKWKCENYLWRAESQRNGNIHFHVVTDVFIPWRRLRTDWNRIQNKLGYVDRFAEKYNHHDPNSTDVHAINKIKNLSSYLSKYCSKNAKGYTMLCTLSTDKPDYGYSVLTYQQPVFDKKAKIYRQIRGRLWGLSQNLSKFKKASCEIYGRVDAELKWLFDRDKKKVVETDFATIYKYSIKDLMVMKCHAIVSKFKSYIDSILEPPRADLEPIRVLPPILDLKPSFVQKSLF